MIQSKSGFTIVETMIFLAISGVTFIMAVTILGNQQRKTQFDQSLTFVESTMNDIANDTSTGVYPEIDNVECQINLDLIQFTILKDAKPGENNECVFVGKIIQVQDDNQSDSNYSVHTLVGINDPEASNFLETAPVPLYSNGSGSTSDFRDAGTETFNIPWGTNVEKAYYIDNGTVKYLRGVAYVYNSFGNDINSTAISSGSANVGLYAVIAKNNPSTKDSSRLSLQDFRNSVNQQIIDSNPSTFVPVTNKITLCLVGLGDKKGMIEIGSVSGSVSARTNYELTEECKS